VTWKVTDGTLTDVPPSLGKWGGYRTTKAIAWLMGVGPKQWVARCGDMASHPLPLAAAKRAAKRMVVSGLHDYLVTDADAPDLNDLTVQCNRANNQTNVVRVSPRVEVLSDSEVELDLRRHIIRIECGV
jgi:hypothetical protein